MLRVPTSQPRLQPRRARVPAQASLTDREVEVVALVVEGCTNPEIATTLVISPRTVQSHVASAMRKLDVHSRTQLAVAALRLAIVPLVPHDPVAPTAAGLAA